MVNTAKEFITSDAMKIVVSMNSLNNRDFNGYLYHQFHKKKVLFEGVCDFINRLQRLFDEFSFPQETFCLRKFESVKNTKKDKMGINMGNKIDMGNKIVQLNTSDARFIIHVKYRQNASWQGTIKWVDTNEEKQFRSVLELLKLMDQAISVTDAEEKVEWTKQA